MDESFNDIEEAEEAAWRSGAGRLHLPQGTSLTASLCVEARKRAIRRKATKFVIHIGELFLIPEENKGWHEI